MNVAKSGFRPAKRGAKSPPAPSRARGGAESPRPTPASGPTGPIRTIATNEPSGAKLTLGLEMSTAVISAWGWAPSTGTRQVVGGSKVDAPGDNGGGVR